MLRYRSGYSGESRKICNFSTRRKIFKAFSTLQFLKNIIFKIEYLAIPIFPIPSILIQAPFTPGSSQSRVPKTGSLNIPHSHLKSEMTFSSCTIPNLMNPSRITPNTMFSLLWCLYYFCSLASHHHQLLSFSFNVINHIYHFSSLLKYKFHYRQEHLTTLFHSVPTR